MTFDTSFIRRAVFRIRGRVVHLRPKGALRGTVLLSYTTLPFLDTRPEILRGHTNRWECMEMARAFLGRGYAVDIVDAFDRHFTPRKRYDFCIGVDADLDRLSGHLNADCIKIFHVCTQHWRANNTREQTRLDAFEKRRGVKARPERMITPNESAEKADLLLLLGNAETERTYAQLYKPVFRIPISTTFTYPAPEHKDMTSARSSFVWTGGAGAIHKGVDLLVEAFARMPEYRLHLFGKYEDPTFFKAYEHELSLPNIVSHGMEDLGGETFKRVADTSLAILSASCAEGQAGATIVGMHAGLIPIVSSESGIDTHDFGITINETSVDTLIAAVRSLAQESDDRLRARSMRTWQYARSHHTRERFASVFANFVEKLENKVQK